LERGNKIKELIIDADTAPPADHPTDYAFRLEKEFEPHRFAARSVVPAE
jgi:hypothetical protein